MTKVTKRDGRQVDFNEEKIVKAILKAFIEVDGDTSEYAYAKAGNIAQYIKKRAEEKGQLSIEEIQDLVENGLMATKRKDVAKAYVKYREKRTKDREKNTDWMQEIFEKLEASNIQNQNANVDEMSFGGRKGEADSVLMKKVALEHFVPGYAAKKHVDNEIYIHDLDSYAVGQHNCAARETKFCTAYDGVRSFKDYEDGDEVYVITHTGEVKKAIVKNFGTQKLNKITFSFCGQRFTTERFTSNHRWILKNGEVTERLKIGDKLWKPPVQIREFDFNTASEKEQYFWCLGFILGDGTTAYHYKNGKRQENGGFVRLRLCGKKVEFEKYFRNFEHNTYSLPNGDVCLDFKRASKLKKEFPILKEMSRGEKIALFQGLYTADGQKSGHSKQILTTNPQIAEFIEKEAPALGWFILKVQDKEGEKTNYATRGFTKNYTFIGDTNKYYWTVTDIQEDETEDVWCLIVEDSHSFVLPNGITTGNCLSIPFDDILAKGFSTRQMDIRPAGSINSAFQLLAVVFQLQSLQQFGGVSATHVDWTMVPYVRKSFVKHYLDGLKYFGTDTKECDREELFNLSIEDEFYKKEPAAFRYAMDMTEKETQQAAEGMFHNLNTLQSRSGN